MSDPLFSLDPIKVDTPIEVYTNPEPGIHYLNENDENAILEEREDEAWVQSLIEDSIVWSQGGWEIKK